MMNYNKDSHYYYGDLTSCNKCSKCNDDEIKEDKCKDCHDKKSRCNVSNNINFYENNIKNHRIDCKPKENEKYGCCCDTTKLREMLIIFRQNNTPVIIFTETLPATGSDFVTPKYIHAIINDMVYVSTTSSSGPVIYIIPICNISFVIAISPTILTGISNILNEIITERPLEKDPCCCISGIGNTLNSLSNATLLLPLSGGFYSISSSPNGVLILVVFLLYSLFLIALGSILTVANDDIYVIYSESTTNDSFYIIVPTCKIDTLVIPQNLDNTNRVKASSSINSPILNSLLFLLDEDMRGKIEQLDITKLTNDIKDKSMDEILEKIKSIIE